jgi:hypothetical protein
MKLKLRRPPVLLEYEIDNLHKTLDEADKEIRRLEALVLHYKDGLEALAWVGWED